MGTELLYTLKEVTASKVVLVGENDTATSVDTINVVPADGGSEITYAADVTLHGVAKLGTPLVKLVFGKLGNDTVEQMTRVLNQLPPSQLV